MSTLADDSSSACILATWIVRTGGNNPVDSAAADTAVSAAERILGAAAKGKVAEDLLARGIEDIKKRFN